jgi:hypothetical protein
VFCGGTVLTTSTSTGTSSSVPTVYRCLFSNPVDRSCQAVDAKRKKTTVSWDIDFGFLGPLSPFPLSSSCSDLLLLLLLLLLRERDPDLTTDDDDTKRSHTHTHTVHSSTVVAYFLPHSTNTQLKTETSHHITSHHICSCSVLWEYGLY